MIEKIRELAEFDIDLASRQFFRLLLDLVDEKPQLARGTIMSIIDRRPLVTDEHLTWLLFACAQYVTAYAFDSLRVPQSKTSLGDMKEKLAQALEHRGEQFIEMCATRNICTNVPSRYSMLQVVAALVYKQEPVHVLDIGCSVGLGLMALNKDVISSVKTDDALLRKMLSEKVNVILYGLDVQTPDLEWLQACYLPEYREERQRAVELYQRFESGEGAQFTFIQGDALSLAKIPGLGPQSFDLVFTSNTCYQIEGELEDVERGIRYLLKPSGWWLYAYYRVEQPGFLRRPDLAKARENNPYVGCLYPAWDWEHPLEVLEAENDEVNSLRRGYDFDEFYRDFIR
jgi:SAM-dependent methyltransferase